MCWRLNLVVTLLLAVVSLSRTIPFNENKDLSRQLPSPYVPQFSTRQVAGIPLHTRETHATEIHQLSSGWSLHLKYHSIILPLTAGANALSAFYSEVMAFAAHASDTYEMEYTTFDLYFGRLLLNLATSEELVPISWDLVHEFAKVMKAMAERGLVGGLEAVLRCGLVEVLVSVSMEGWIIAGEAAEAA